MPDIISFNHAGAPVLSQPPKHVNHDLSPMKCPVDLDDVDLFGEGAQEHWYEAYEILHRESPVHRIEGGGLQPGTHAYVLTKHADVTRVVKDPDRFPTLMTLGLQRLAAEGLTPEEVYARGHHLMEASMVSLRPNQELYLKHRRELTDPWVGVGATRHAAMIERHAHDLIDEWVDAGRVDFIARFARPLPQRVMASVLGFPQEDVPKLEYWGTAAVTPFVYGQGPRHQMTKEQGADMRSRLEGFQDYIYQHVIEKRRDPQDDMVSFLCEVHYEALDRKLTDIEIAGIVYAMILGGLETTQYALEEQAQLVCEHPGLFDVLREDRAKVPYFIEEGMRLRAPTHGLSTRITSRDEIFQGIAVPEGSLLHLRFGAANVDEETFACPHAIDLDRKAIKSHVTFSTGPRVCPGASLSRLEQTIAWNALLDRLEGIEYGEDNDWLHQPGIMLGTLRLDLRIVRDD